MKPLLISVQGSAFRGSLRLAIQSTAKSTYIHEIYVHHNNKKIRTIHRSDLSSTKLSLFICYTSPVKL
ncbi:hypothetical protein [Priestia megaterium]|uniref:hypothetical protein n=1 Tax=Priestia megaterium TaxID=1404 RepID=UPI0004B49612|nr:hypothetical protein [Priestia megaterium]MCM3185742.1 hypothetical protein [Priestia megaterium]